TADILILKIQDLRIAQRAKARRVFLVLEVSFKTLSIYSLGADHYPGNTESGDRSYQLCARSVSVRGNAEADVMPSVMKLVFEVDQIDEMCIYMATSEQKDRGTSLRSF